MKSFIFKEIDQIPVWTKEDNSWMLQVSGIPLLS